MLTEDVDSQLRELLIVYYLSDPNLNEIGRLQLALLLAEKENQKLKER